MQPRNFISRQHLLILNKAARLVPKHWACNFKQLHRKKMVSMQKITNLPRTTDDFCQSQFALIGKTKCNCSNLNFGIKRILIKFSEIRTIDYVYRLHQSNLYTQILKVWLTILFKHVMSAGFDGKRNYRLIRKFL